MKSKDKALLVLTISPLILGGSKAGLDVIIKPKGGRLSESRLWVCAYEGGKTNEKDKQKMIVLKIAANKNSSFSLLK